MSSLTLQIDDTCLNAYNLTGYSLTLPVLGITPQISSVWQPDCSLTAAQATYFSTPGSIVAVSSIAWAFLNEFIAGTEAR